MGPAPRGRRTTGFRTERRRRSGLGSGRHGAETEGVDQDHFSSPGRCNRVHGSSIGMECQALAGTGRRYRPFHVASSQNVAIHGNRLQREWFALLPVHGENQLRYGSSGAQFERDLHSHRRGLAACIQAFSFHSLQTIHGPCDCPRRNRYLWPTGRVMAYPNASARQIREVPPGPGLRSVAPAAN